MKSRRNPRFHRAFRKLPTPAQDLARTAYQRFRADPYDPRLDFHDIKGTKAEVYAVDVGTHNKTAYRALGVWDKKQDVIVWFWIGSHEAYNNVVARL